MQKKIAGLFNSAKGSSLVKNGFWGIAGSIGRSIFLSLFYIIVGRIYAVDEFSKYLIASTLYQAIVVFSSMGLGHWFIREVITVTDKSLFIKQFLKMQIILGLLFFLLSISLAFVLYDEVDIRILSVIFSFNIIFDNIINCIKNVNVAEYAQKRTSKIIVLESFLSFSLAISLYIYPFSIYLLVSFLVLIRFATLNIFLKTGLKDIDIKSFLTVPVSFEYFKSIIKRNWPFIIIGSASMIYWRSATIIVSKTLPLENVAFYENSFKLFSLAQLIPVMFGVTIFPKFVEYFRANKIQELKALYKKVFWLYVVYSMLGFTFIYSFASTLIPFIFGEKYLGTAHFTVEMFATFLLFPTAFLQAQLLVALNKEKLDMWFNVWSVLLNTTLCFVGIYYFKSLTVVNVSIFISFFIFHLLQDRILIKSKISSLADLFWYIGLSVGLITAFVALHNIVHEIIAFLLFWAFIVSITTVIWKRKPSILKL